MIKHLGVFLLLATFTYAQAQVAPPSEEPSAEQPKPPESHDGLASGFRWFLEKTGLAPSTTPPPATTPPAATPPGPSERPTADVSAGQPARIRAGIARYFGDVDQEALFVIANGLVTAPSPEGLDQLMSALKDSGSFKDLMNALGGDRNKLRYASAHLAAALGLIDACFTLKDEKDAPQYALDVIPGGNGPDRQPAFVAVVSKETDPYPSDPKACGLPERTKAQEQLVTDISSKMDAAFPQGPLPDQQDPQGRDLPESGDGLGQDGQPGDGGAPGGGPGGGGPGGGPGGGGSEGGGGSGGGGSGSGGSPAGGGGGGGGAQYQKNKGIQLQKNEYPEPKFNQVQMGEPPQDVQLDEGMKDGLSYKGPSEEQLAATKAQMDSFEEQVVGWRTKAMEIAAQLGLAYMKSSGPRGAVAATGLQVMSSSGQPGSFLGRVRAAGGNRASGVALQARTASALGQGMMAQPAKAPRSTQLADSSQEGFRQSLGRALRKPTDIPGRQIYLPVKRKNP